MKTELYEKNLLKTAAFFKKARTVAELADKFGISRFAAYERVQVLAQRGELACAGFRAVEGKTGPKALCWVKSKGEIAA